MRSRSPLLLLAALAVFPGVARGESPATTPMEYCRALTKEFDHYARRDAHHIASLAYGEAACKEHDAVDAIPALEKALIDDKLPLPPHLPSAEVGRN